MPESSSGDSPPLNDLEERHQALVKALPFPAVELDARGSVVVCNSAFSKVVNVAIDCLVGQVLWEAAGRCAYTDQFIDDLKASRAGTWSKGAKCHSWQPLPMGGCLLTIVETAAAPEDHVAAYRGGHVGVWDVSFHPKTAYFSPETSSLFGYAPGAMANTLEAWDPLVHPDDRARRDESLEAVFAGKSDLYRFEGRFLTGDGTYRWYQNRAAAVRDAEGKLLRLHGATTEITEAKEAEEHLRAARERLETLLLVSPAVVYTCEPFRPYACTFISPNIEKMTGYTPNDFLSDPLFQEKHIHPDDLARAMSAVNELSVNEEVQSIDYRFLFRDGTYRWMHDQFRLLRNPDGTPRQIVGSWFDIEARKQAEQALEKSVNFARSVAHAMPDLLFVYDLAEQRHVYVNRTSFDELGYTADQLAAFGGEVVTRLLHPDDRATAVLAYKQMASAEAGSVAEMEYRVLAANGEYRWLRGRITIFQRNADGSPLQIIGVARDVTEAKGLEEEQRRLDEKIRRTQKLESLGVLAGGVAHEFNNLLTGILGFAGLALLDLPEISPAREPLERITRAGTRAAELCRQMLAYSGHGRFSLEAIDLSGAIRDLVPLLKASLPKKVTLALQLTGDPTLVEVDMSQLRQIVFNLVINAAEALGTNEGTVVIRTGRIRCDRLMLARTYVDDDLPAGEYAFLEVVDDGPGMDTATQARVFEPFFSTKFTGRGLGLAAVLGIVRGHRGAIQLESAPACGASFRVMLPMTSPPAVESLQPRSESQGGVILLVDDEDLIRDLGRVVLERAGFSVIGANDGIHALEVLKSRPGGVDVVVLDLTMPRLSGEETLLRLREIDAKVPVILSSGYAADEARQRFNHATGFLQKPYRPHDLVAAIRRVLGNPPST